MAYSEINETDHKSKEGDVILSLSHTEIMELKMLAMPSSRESNVSSDAKYIQRDRMSRKFSIGNSTR